jgi:hypothetical protein
MMEQQQKVVEGGRSVEGTVSTEGDRRVTGLKESQNSKNRSGTV